MNQKALLQIGSEILHQVRHGDGPADRIIGDIFREKKFLGASDKRFLGDVLWYVLRHLRRIDEAILSAFEKMVVAEERFSSGFPVTSSMGLRAWQRRLPGERLAELPRQRMFDRAVDTLRLGLAAMEQKLMPVEDVSEELERAWPKLKERSAPKLETIQRLVERSLEVMATFGEKHRSAAFDDRRFSFPSWLWGLLAIGHLDEDADRFGAALNETPPVTLRINTLKTSPEQARAVLDEARLEYDEGQLSPTALSLKKRMPAAAIPNLREGWFEVQDEGSQLISLYAAPQKGWTVVDACAGGGGKTLHMAALMENEGRIIPLDKDPRRLMEAPRRSERAGVKILDWPEETPKDADLVLIDAPCSGTGTLRRSPEIRWRLTQGQLEYVRNTQQELLDEWAARVKIGGYLVYATCSLLEMENADQIRWFLGYYKNFEIAPPENFPVPLTEEGFLRLQPHLQGTDGFFAARLRRTQ